MLQINRLKINICSEKRDFGFDEVFKPGLNFVASDDNTKGKSSVIIAIYYCLGMEEIIGGQGEKVLTSVYKESIEVNGETYPVLQSDIYLEITNGTDPITIYRSAKKEGRNSQLITVYFSSLDKLNSSDTTYEDYYLHLSKSATNDKGFYTFLEQYLNLELPLVPANDGNNRKLYLQLLFSAMLIEQKKGWTDIYSGMPYLGIREAKKRVTEYILALNTFETARKRNLYKEQETKIQSAWKAVLKEISREQTQNQCYVSNIPASPEILVDDFEEIVAIQYIDGRPVENYIVDLTEEIDSLKTVRPKVEQNYEELQKELSRVEEIIETKEDESVQLRRQLRIEKRQNLRLQDDIDVIDQDIENNKDAKKLQNLGSQIQCKSFEGVCPTCGQKINDSLLSIQHSAPIMTIDESIKHLQAQRDMLSFAQKTHAKKIEEIDFALQILQSQIFDLYKLAKTLRRDLYSVDEDLSETIIYKRISLQKKIEDIQTFKSFVRDCSIQLKELGEQWRTMLANKAALPRSTFTDRDQLVIKGMENIFKKNLSSYNYTSVANIKALKLSEDNYMPMKDNFDMKFDSSASDNIRAIWAYTMALLQTSIMYDGNHVGFIIFDEPAQHSIGADDAKKFFESMVELKDNSQIIVGITLNSQEINAGIQNLGIDNYHMIHIKERALM